MANLKEVRNRIQSVITTQQITLAMKLVSAAKLRKAQDRIISYRPFARQMQKLFTNILSNLGDVENSLLENRELKHVTFVIFSANRGLCGTFNSNVIKYSFQLFQQEYAPFIENKAYTVLALGKKVAEALQRKHIVVSETYHDLIEKPSWNKIAELGEQLISSFQEKKTDQIVIVYNQFKNAAVFIPFHEILLPFTITSQQKNNDLYIFEPEANQILSFLIPLQIKVTLFKALLESVAAEHGARMIAMHKATDNATEMLKELRLYYNKVRQASITKEIIEIMSGAEALKQQQ